MKKVTISFILALFATLFLASCAEEQTPDTPRALELMGKSFSNSSGAPIPTSVGVGSNARLITHTVLQNGLYTLVEKRSVLTANSFPELNAIWAKHSTNPLDFPQVNLESETVIAVFSGIRSNSGYTLEVTKIWESNGKLVVGIKEKVESGVTLTVITNPNLWLKIPKTNLPIEVYFE